MLARRPAGATLIELIIAIVVVSVSIAGITLIYRQVVQSSADPLLRKQAIAAAESTLEEIERKFYSDVDAAAASNSCYVSAPGMRNQTERPYFSCLSDYDGFATNGIYSFDEQVLPAALASYTVSVAVAAQAALGGSVGAATLNGNCRQITVTVTTPQGEGITISSYRCDYANGL